MLLQRSFLTSWFSKFLLVVFLITPAFVSAQGTEGDSGLRTSIFGSLQETAFGIYDVDTSGSPDQILTSRLNAGVNLAIGALGVVAVILIIYAGFLWLTAGGNSDQVQQAIRIIKRVVVGIVIVSLAFAIIAFVLSAIPTSDNLTEQQNNQIIEEANPIGGGSVPVPL